MNREQHAVQKPCGNCGRAKQNSCVGGEQYSYARGTTNEETREQLQKLIDTTAENVPCVKLEPDQARNYTGAESKNDPRANRHRRFVFEHAQHVEKQTRTPKIHYQKNRPKDCPDRCDPHRCHPNIAAAKNKGDQRDCGGHSGKTADKKVNWNFPGPHRWLKDRLTVVPSFARNRA